MKTIGRYRRTVVRGGRRFIVCGLLLRPAVARPDTAAPLSMWVPGTALVLVLLFSAFIIGRPAGYPLATQSNAAHANLARFTIDDFVNAAR